MRPNLRFQRTAGFAVCTLKHHNVVRTTHVETEENLEIFP